MNGPPSPSRRDFVRVAGSAVLVPALARGSPSESAVARFFRSLRADQRAELAFPADHPLRSRASNHWAVARPTVAELSADQKALCGRIVRELLTEDGHRRLLRVMDDDGGGFDRYHPAVFGDPDSPGAFQWVLTGRHVTIRADGRSAEATVPSGPLFLGHSQPGERNVWAALGDRAKRALGAPEVGPARIADLLRALIGPFRAFAMPEVGAGLDAPDKLRLTGYRQGGAWTLEGPGFSWYFHDSPHVHGWLVVGDPARPGAG